MGLLTHERSFFSLVSPFEHVYLPSNLPLRAQIAIFAFWPPYCELIISLLNRCSSEGESGGQRFFKFSTVLDLERWTAPLKSHSNYGIQ